MVTQTITLPSQESTADTMSSDTEKAIPTTAAKPNAVPSLDPFHDLVAGYPKLADHIGSLPEIAMFRRFGALNARNLLYMQNDLVMLERKLKMLEVEDSKSSEGKKERYRRDSYWLTTANIKVKRWRYSAAGPGNENESSIERLHQTDNTLIQQATILREMKKPDPLDIHDIQNLIASDDMEQPFVGFDRTMWGSAFNGETRKSYSRELVVLRARKDIDTLSRIVGTRAIKWIMACGGQRWKKEDVRWGMFAIHDSTIFRLTFWFTSAIASLLPVVSIILLVKMESLNGRLGLIAAFNVLTSILLTLCTEARRTDVFAVTAAFAAVQVVFVGQVIEKAPQEVVIAASKMASSAC